MADPVPHFLVALELEADADERAIRRAYARRLKRIDPESDPAGFQALRETFEAALAWVAQPAGRRPRVAPADAGARTPAMAPTPPVPAAPDTAPGIDGPPAATGAFSWSTDDAKGAPPQAPGARRAAPQPRPAAVPVPAGARTAPTPPAAAPARPPAGPSRPPATPPTPARGLQQDPAAPVFAEFSDRFTRTASNEADAARLLREALADARLVNLEARTSFEARVAQLLAGGWRPGHEWLFQPACDAFEWETDRRRLDTFGPAGALLDAAVRERLIFFAQPAVVFEAQKALIRRLRTERPTDARTLAPEMARLGLMMQHFPGWMSVMTRRDVVQHWFDAWSALPEAQRGEARGLSAAAPERAPAAARAPAGARAASRPAAQSAGAGRAPTRPPPLPPVRPYAAPPPRPFLGGFEGSGRTAWLVAAFIAGVLRLFSSLDATPHRAPAPMPALPTGESEAVPAPAPPSPTQAIRDLAARGTPSADDDSPMNTEGAATNPIEFARQQRRQEALARRQAQIDQRYQELQRSQQGKQAIRDPDEGRQAVTPTGLP